MYKHVLSIPAKDQLLSVTKPGAFAEEVAVSPLGAPFASSFLCPPGDTCSLRG